MELCLFLVVAFVLFGSALHGPCLFDDIPVLLANPKVLEGNFRFFQTIYFRSIVMWTYAMNIHIWGKTPEGKSIHPLQTFPLHATNVVIHAMNAWIVYGIFQVLGLGWHLSVLGGLMFVGHPLTVNAVANITGRAILMSGFFGFLGILAVLSGYPLLAIPAFILSFASKEDTAILPLTLGLLALVKGSLWGIALLGLPLVLGWVLRRHIKELLSHNGTERLGQAGIGFNVSPWTYRVIAFTETVFRFPQWVIGAKLNLDADIPPVIVWKKTVLAMLLCVAAVIAFFLSPEIVQIGLILACISPLILYWAFPMPDFVMDYRAYLALPGVCLLLTLGLSYLPAILVTPMIGWLWFVTAYRSFDWTDFISLWSGCLRDGSSRKPRVLVNMGSSHMFRKEYRQAQEYYIQALKVNPNAAPAWANLALIETYAENYDGAEGLLKQCVLRCPRYQAGWNALGQLYAHLKRQPEADRCFAEMAKC